MSGSAKKTLNPLLVGIFSRHCQIWVITQYKKSTNPIEEKIGESLARLRKKRNKADYLDQPQICENEARSAYLEAQKVLYNLKRI